MINIKTPRKDLSACIFLLFKWVNFYGALKAILNALTAVN